MGAKKKGGKKGGGKKGGKKSADDEEDISTEKFWKMYRKKCVEYETDVCKEIKKLWEAKEENGTDIQKLHLWDELGWPGVKAITDALKASADPSYQHLQSIRLWKTYCQDEGVRLLCSFLERKCNVEGLDLLDNKITYIGCEQLARTLSPDGPHICPPIKHLKLDHN